MKLQAIFVTHSKIDSFFKKYNLNHRFPSPTPPFPPNSLPFHFPNRKEQASKRQRPTGQNKIQLDESKASY